MTRVLIVGGGGREHALAWACARGRNDVELTVAPGNGGTAAIAENVPVDVTDAAAVARLARERDVDLVVIGPDAAAAAGVADACAADGIAVFGPTAAAARIESSKTFAKQLMDSSQIPTARWRSGGADERDELRAFIHELRGRCAVKADGLALGKGVAVSTAEGDALDALDACLQERRFGDAGDRVVVEELLEGREVSVFGISDGTHVRVLPSARDHKRLLDGDRGPNTGGMGAVAPLEDVDSAALRDITASVLQPCIDSLRERGTPFVGCLYAGLIITAAGLRVLEFNARFGDPETQVVLPLVDEPVLALLEAAAHGSLASGTVATLPGSAAGVVLAAAGYPGSVRTGDVISGVEGVDDDVLCFHAGTRREAGVLRTSGGRVLALVAQRDSVDDARRAVYGNISGVHFDGMQFRTDIGVSRRHALAGAQSA